MLLVDDYRELMLLVDDYREIGPPGNGKTRKTGASSLAAVRKTARHVELHANRVIFRGALK